MVTQAHKVRTALLANGVLLLLVAVLIGVFGRRSSDYFRYGPSEDLNIVGVPIANWYSYATLHALLLLLTVSEAIIHDLTMPGMFLTVFDPHEDRVEVTSFGRTELNFYINAMDVISGVRQVITVMLVISQLDIAMAQVIYRQFGRVFTVSYLLRQKRFVTTAAAEEEIELVPKQ